MMRNHHRHAAVAANAEGLVHRLKDRFKLRAQVSGVNTLLIRQLFRQGHHLFGGGRKRRGIGQTGAQPQRALLQCAAQLLAHGNNFFAIGRAEQVIHLVAAQGGMPDQRRHIHRGCYGFHLLTVCGNRRVNEMFFLTQQVHRVRHLGSDRRTGRADTTVTDNHRGHAL
ncbi:hypothetical protein D3C81_1305960 [compost metagenome]